MEKTFDEYLTNKKKIELLGQNNGPDPDIKFLGHLNLIAYTRNGKFFLTKKGAGGFFPQEMNPHNEKFRKWLKEIIEDTTHINFQ